MKHLRPHPPAWRTSSYSSGSEETHVCVEVAPAAGGALVRDSKNPRHGNLSLEPAQWGRFLRAVKRTPAA